MGAVCVEQLQAEKARSAGLQSELLGKDDVMRREREGVGPQPHHMADLLIGQQQGAHSQAAGEQPHSASVRKDTP